MIRQAVRFADRWYWVLLALAAPILLFPSPARTAVLLVVPVGWIVAWLATGRPLPVTPLNGSLLLLYTMVLVSLYATYDVAVSLPKISGMVLGIGVFFIVARQCPPLRPPASGGRETQTPPPVHGGIEGGWWAKLTAFLLVGTGVAVVGLLGTRWMAKFSVFKPLTSSFMAYITTLPGAKGGLHPNEVAGALLWVVPLLLAFSLLLLTRTRSVGRTLGLVRAIGLMPLVLVAAIFVTGVFLLTQSRGGYVGLGLTLTILLLVALPRGWRLLLAICIAGTVVAVVYFVSQARTEIVWQQWFDMQVAINPGLSAKVLPSRVECWSCALLGVQDFKFTGMGMNTFRGVGHVLYPQCSRVFGRDVAHAHNEFLQTGLDLGVPGLIAFIALYLGAFMMLSEVWRRTSLLEARGRPEHLSRSPLASRPLARALILGLGGGLLAHAIYGMTDAVALGAKPGVLFWMLLGLICGLHAQTRSDPDDAASPF